MNEVLLKCSETAVASGSAHVMKRASQMVDKRILIIDDNPDNRYIFGKVLETAGFQQIEEVGDSLEAVATFRRFRPHLVLLDLRMPHMDGFEVLRRLRTESDVPVVITSADNSIETRAMAVQLGATDLFQSFDMQELISIARRHLLGN